MQRSASPGSRGKATVAAFAFLLCAAGPLFAEDIIPVADVRPGMTGVGRTVFSGAEIEIFQVEVIDVLHKIFAGQDLILIRVKHPVTDRTGVIAGMSGSPIYLGGRLAGALAYAWPFAKEPIAGVTPIEYMLREGKRPLEKTGFQPAGDTPTALVPCETPLVLAGFSARAAEYLEEALRPYHIVPLQGGAGGAARKLNLPLKPGAAVAVQLIRGDLEAAAVGTVTTIADGKVYAFGHPFLAGGESALPMSAAWVHTVIPSVARSFKLASSANELGAMTQDRQSCIVGVLDRRARTIPVKVQVRNARTQASRAFRFEVAEHDLLTPVLANAAVLSALEVTEEASGENTVAVKVTAGVRGYEPVTWTDCFSNRQRVSAAAFLAPLVRMVREPFEKAVFDSIDVELEVRTEAAAATLKSAWWAEDAVRPGAAAHLVCLLRPFRGELETVTVAVPVPADVPPGTALKVTVAAGPQLPPEVGPVVRLRELLEQVRRAHAGNTLVTAVSLPRSTLRMKGVEYDRLPNSILGAWVPGILEEAELAPTTLRIVTPSQYVLNGSVSLTLQVVK